MTDYCTPADVYSFGLPRGSVANPGRVAASALSTTNAVTLDLHGFSADDPVTLRSEAGGNLPAPLVEGTTYYVSAPTDNTFKLAASTGGAVIDLTTDGENVVVIPKFTLPDAIRFASEVMTDMMPAHVMPLEAPFPPIVVMTCAELSASKMASMVGGTSVALAATVDAAQKRLERWGKGVAIRGTNTPPAAGLSASASVPYRDRRGWSRFGGTDDGSCG